MVVRDSLGWRVAKRAIWFLLGIPCGPFALLLGFAFSMAGAPGFMIFGAIASVGFLVGCFSAFAVGGGIFGVTLLAGGGFGGLFVTALGMLVGGAAGVQSGYLVRRTRRAMASEGSAQLRRWLLF